jgi:hypothetical protein
VRVPSKLYKYLHFREIEYELARNIFPVKNYYDDDYFKYLFYFKYQYFSELVDEYTKNADKAKEMINIRGLYTDIQKLEDKFKITKFSLNKIKTNDLKILHSGISVINKIFANAENELQNEQQNSYLNKIIADKSFSKVKNTFVPTKTNKSS